MTSPRLTLVMPSFNQGQFIGRAIESVRRQYADANLQLIVRDAMSDDDTACVLDTYSDVPWLRVVRQPDAGQSDALAAAFADAPGEIFGWLNSDDVLFDGAVSTVLDVFDAKPGIDVVYGDAVFIDEADAVVGRFPTARPTIESLRHRCVISQPSVFFRREAYFRVGGIRPQRRFCMDYELWTRLCRDGAVFHFTPRVLSGTRLHAETKTANGGRAFVDEICRMQEEVLSGVSPVWRIYQRSRSEPLQGRSKLLRFARATYHEIRARPRLLPLVAGAFGERLRAQLSARIRCRHVPI